MPYDREVEEGHELLSRGVRHVCQIGKLKRLRVGHLSVLFRLESDGPNRTVLRLIDEGASIRVESVGVDDDDARRYDGMSQ